MTRGRWTGVWCLAVILLATAILIIHNLNNANQVAAEARQPAGVTCSRVDPDLRAAHAATAAQTVRAPVVPPAIVAALLADTAGVNIPRVDGLNLTDGTGLSSDAATLQVDTSNVTQAGGLAADQSASIANMEADCGL